ncbi:hypothetical protein FA09DRAFT_10565 [Tilletiopsis washingtonensis]|uniref:Uncharacterized protein n=1 Tax=Tilletiopsis washingtonensis TaxID=58919 RepID=A0A316ZJQ6_9BASI|nr:hypothetical protein FA09DRAFT_10565 [Tilletiopsis washingtonensis]PWO01325.1 hypothetical protein FA09DRAFT_10565 [Tilletiopsis washingtonensis]
MALFVRLRKEWPSAACSGAAALGGLGRLPARSRGAEATRQGPPSHCGARPLREAAEMALEPLPCRQSQLGLRGRREGGESSAEALRAKPLAVPRASRDGRGAKWPHSHPEGPEHSVPARPIRPMSV